MKCGPQPTLTLIGIQIDTWQKYICMQCFILVFQIVDTVVQEFAQPVLGNLVYNTEVKVIENYTKFQLQFYCQSLWFVNNLKYAMMIIISISQIDVAFSKVIYSELASVFTLRILLNKKQFGNLGATSSTSTTEYHDETTPLSVDIV